MKPFYSKLDFNKARLVDYDQKFERRLSDIRPYVKNKQALDEMKAEEDQLVYEVLQIDIPKEAGQIQHSITIIKSGTIDGECFFTKGHYHSNEESAEIYMGLKGKGVLLMQQGEKVEIMEMEKGTVAYIPPEWAHRTINVGDNEFVFMSYFPGDAGYDYSQLMEEGIQARIYKTETGYKKVSE